MFVQFSTTKLAPKTTLFSRVLKTSKVFTLKPINFFSDLERVLQKKGKRIDFPENLGQVSVSISLTYFVNQVQFG